jgi:uncharacterized repeat protein (TIGR01451 family)
MPFHRPGLKRIFLGAFVCLLCPVGEVFCQPFTPLYAPATIRTITPAPRPAYPPPARGPAPLLYIRFLGPDGLSVTIFQGQAAGRTFQAPFSVGFRPGYIYRIKVSGFPRRPGAMMFPSLEVVGTLCLPPRLKAGDYPAPVELTEEDFERVVGGAVLTKVVVLENPERSVPTATRPDQPLESQVPASQDPLEAARERGRPVLVVRMGQRQFTPEQMARQAIPGTILLPEDKSLAAPACRPYLPWAGAPVYDPISGPKPGNEECLRDGGDQGQKAGLDRNGHLQGLDPADTVAEYSDTRGQRRLAISNCVCICVPRFLVLRSETVLASYHMQVSPGDTQVVQGHQSVQTKMTSEQTRQNEHLSGLSGRERLRGAINSQNLGRIERLEVLSAYQMDIGPGTFLGTKMLSKLTRDQRVLLKKQMEYAQQLGQPYGLGGVGQVQAGPTAVGRMQGVNVLGTLQEVRAITVTCNQAPVPPPAGKPLALYKWADKQGAKVGEVVTMFLKYSNQGGQPITDVALSDSLTGRLEYLPGSAKSDRDAVFTMQNNEAGSVILRWEVSGKLQAGESGVVSFQARVR